MKSEDCIEAGVVLISNDEKKVKLGAMNPIYQKVLDIKDELINNFKVDVEVTQISTDEWEKWNTSENSFKDTLKNISDTKSFVVNIVSKELINQMNVSSGNYSKETDEFILSKLEKSNCVNIDVPRVKKSPASLECKLYKILELPGLRNNMVIGKVIGIHIDDKYLQNGIFDVLTFNPVARMGYKDYTIINTKFELERPK